jgi:hypothetical protein
MLASTAFFFLLDSAITRRSSATTSGKASFQASHRVLASTSLGPIVEFCFSGEEDVSRGHRIRPYLEDRLDHYRPTAVLLDFTECRQFFDNDVGSIIPALMDKDRERSRPCALLFGTERAAKKVRELLEVLRIADTFGVKVFDNRDSALTYLRGEIDD